MSGETTRVIPGRSVCRHLVGEALAAAGRRDDQRAARAFEHGTDRVALPGIEASDPEPLAGFRLGAFERGRLGEAFSHHPCLVGAEIEALGVGRDRVHHAPYVDATARELRGRSLFSSPRRGHHLDDYPSCVQGGTRLSIHLPRSFSSSSTFPSSVSMFDSSSVFVGGHFSRGAVPTSASLLPRAVRWSFTTFRRSVAWAFVGPRVPSSWA